MALLKPLLSLPCTRYHGLNQFAMSTVSTQPLIIYSTFTSLLVQSHSAVKYHSFVLRFWTWQNPVRIQTMLCWSSETYIFTLCFSMLTSVKDIPFWLFSSIWHLPTVSRLESGITVLNCPENWQDLNPTENLGCIVKRKVWDITEHYIFMPVIKANLGFYNSMLY